MKSSGRRQMRTPVGNKTKRGAELEGTPKTPRSFEASPEKPTCMNDSSSQEPEDRRLQLRSTRRPLQWRGTDMAHGGDESLENTRSPRQQKGHPSKSNAVAALSPICVNAIHGNSDPPWGWKSGMRRPNDLPPSLLSPSMKDRDGAFKRTGYGKAPDDARWVTIEHQGAAESVDTGSCPSSTDCRILPLSGERMFIWNNAAFHQGSVHEETVCTGKDTASSGSCCSSASSSRLKATITECEAESKATDKDALPDVKCFEVDGINNYNTNGKHNVTVIVSETVGAVDARQQISNSDLTTGLGDKEERKPIGLESQHVEGSVARKFLFVDRELHGSKATNQAEEHKGFSQAGHAGRNKNDPLGIGLDEIEQEIQRLTERLKELQLQKREREEEMRRQDEEKSKKGGTTSSNAGRKEDANRGRPATLQQQQSKRGVTGTGRGNGAVSSSASVLLQSPSSQSCYKGSGAVSKSAKLSEIRRSVSSASRRMEGSDRNSNAVCERTKVFRRLSLSGVVMSAPLNTNDEKSHQQGSLSSKGTPSRVVSSRYNGRATTPDACRPSGGSSTACKKRDRPSSAASSPSPFPAASVACSPLKKVATLRSGYPSRSGLATPNKQRQEPTATTIRSSNAPAPFSSRAQNRVLGLHSPSKSSVSRIDSPKSTAALYKCLESLLEDSKHFFKHLSPARSHVLHNLPQLQQPIATASSSPIAALSALLKPQQPNLPSISTFRLDAISPRDSGCVKRASDRQKKHFFFAREEASPQPLEC